MSDISRSEQNKIDNEVQKHAFLRNPFILVVVIAIVVVAVTALYNYTRVEKAITLVKHSHVESKVKTTEEYIKELMQKRTGYLKVYGWEAEHIEGDVYLVWYLFETREGQGRGGYVYEVQLDSEIVRKVSGNAELEKKYGLTQRK